jgi:hypothetical protein
MINFRFSRNRAEDYAVRGSASNVDMVRTILGVLAGLLGSLGLWILVAELTSPRTSYFPASPNEVDAMYAVRDSAITAAKLGFVRGDLWTVAAITTAGPLLFGAAGSSREQASQAELENIRAIADRAARLSPHDSRIWLVLASLDLRVGGSNIRGTEMLKLSYETGPNEISLMPLRLLLAVKSGAILDEEVQSSVRLDIQRIIMQRPDLKPSIALAYQNALPKGRAIIETTLKETDPSFLATIAVPHRGDQVPD